jgi:hypothetical protein
MSDNFKFPTDTCVLVCSGPSLNLVDPFLLGVPVVVVSTAIRKISNPHYWILADYLNEMHGAEGNAAYQNENIVKIVPKGKVNVRHNALLRNYYDIPYSNTDKTIPNVMDHLFSGQLPLLKGPHKSVTFAVQWLHHVGVKNIIWVGNNLHAASAHEKYAYESTATDLKKSHNYTVTLDQVHRALKDWYPKAQSLGHKWYSWKCGEVFEKIVPVFEPEKYNFPESSIYYDGVGVSQHAIQSAVVNKPQNSSPRTKKIDRRVARTSNKSKSIEEQKRINQERIKQQAKAKIEELEVRKNTSRIEKIQKTPVTKIKYPKYVKLSKNASDLNKGIKDSLR